MQALLDLALDVVLSPALWMCVLFGAVYAVLFTLWRGGKVGQFLRDLTVGVLGFGLGQVLATLVRVPTVRVGEVHLLWGSLFAVLALLVGRRYWRPRPRWKAPPESAEPKTPASGAPAP